MKVIAFYNIKGGVGKTASAVNLAYYAALEGARTLVWDLDPQGAATYYFRIKPKVKGGTRALLRRDRSLVVNLVVLPLFLYPVFGFGAYQVIITSSPAPRP